MGSSHRVRNKEELVHKESRHRHNRAQSNGCSMLMIISSCLFAMRVSRSCRSFNNSRHSMYAIYAYIDPSNHPNVGKCTIHGVSGNN